MDLISPCPRYNANGIACPELPPGSTSDYNENSPIASNGNILQPFCKYKTPWPTPAATWVAGQDVTVQFEQHGSAHGGGHCEFSLSYDGGTNFVVVHQVMGHCFYDSSNREIRNYTFTLPADAPGSDSAIFSWTWVNAIGNREFYQNCADIAITGASSSLSGKAMTILNYPGYPTIPEFMGNFNTGVEYYQNATTITVYP
ncbi:hypothetical protein EC988_004608 [Linderina pennispora]|nr:hypothetical protein EC988_004608 [Linderina pennispora]